MNIYGKPSKRFLRNKLLKILEYRTIHISGAELRDYDRRELNTLISMFDIRVHQADNKNNSWYGNRRYYI
jgi:hypothetical protein